MSDSWKAQTETTVGRFIKASLSTKEILGYNTIPTPSARW